MSLSRERAGKPRDFPIKTPRQYKLRPRALSKCRQVRPSAPKCTQVRPVTSAASRRHADLPMFPNDCDAIMMRRATDLLRSRVACDAKGRFGRLFGARFDRRRLQLRARGLRHRAWPARRSRPRRPSRRAAALLCLGDHLRRPRGHRRAAADDAAGRILRRRPQSAARLRRARLRWPCGRFVPGLSSAVAARCRLYLIGGGFRRRPHLRAVYDGALFCAAALPSPSPTSSARAFRIRWCAARSR